jgi:CheY-like chemotaxis protein
MTSNIAIVVAEDNEGHAILIRRNLKRGNVDYPIIHVRDGEEAMNFFTGRGEGPHREEGVKYILLLDISMPKMSGVEVLKQLKNSNELSWIPVIMVTTTDNPTEMERCYSLGCVNYIRKHIDYDQFSTEIRQLGSYILDLDFTAPT